MITINLMTEQVRDQLYYKRYKERHPERLKARQRITARKWRATHPEEHRAKVKKWQSNNHKKVRDTHRKVMYKLPNGKYDEMLEQQNHVCGICGQTNTNGKALSVDHDHKCCLGIKSCGKCVRGLLCDSCNKALGQLKDSPELLLKAIEYLRNYERIRCNNAFTAAA